MPRPHRPAALMRRSRAQVPRLHPPASVIVTGIIATHPSCTHGVAAAPAAAGGAGGAALLPFFQRGARRVLLGRALARAVADGEASVGDPHLGGEARACAGPLPRRPADTRARCAGAPGCAPGGASSSPARRPMPPRAMSSAKWRAITARARSKPPSRKIAPSTAS